MSKREQPSAEKIQKYLEYVGGLSAFQGIHTGDVEPVKDLVEVRAWLESLADD